MRDLRPIARFRGDCRFTSTRSLPANQTETAVIAATPVSTGAPTVAIADTDADAVAAAGGRHLPVGPDFLCAMSSCTDHHPMTAPHQRAGWSVERVIPPVARRWIAVLVLALLA